MKNKLRGKLMNERNQNNMIDSKRQKANDSLIDQNSFERFVHIQNIIDGFSSEGNLKEWKMMTSTQFCLCKTSFILFYLAFLNRLIFFFLFCQ